MVKGWGDNPFFANFSMDRILEINRANAEFAQRAHHIALKGAADLVSKHTAAIKETYDQLNSLYSETDFSASPADVSKHQQDCAKATMLRAIEHMRLAIDLAGDTNQETYKLAQEAMKEVYSPAPSKPNNPDKK